MLHRPLEQGVHVANKNIAQELRRDIGADDREPEDSPEQKEHDREAPSTTRQDPI